MALRLLVVVNGSAGTAEQEAVDRALTVLIAGAGVEVAATGDLDELAKALARRDGRRVVVVGGDGSLHAALQALHDADALDPAEPLGLVPLGTGNDLARTTGIPLDPAEAAAVALTGRARPLDLAVDDTGTVLVNAAHVGIGAEAGRWAHAWKPALGVAAYPLGAVAAGVVTAGVPLAVEIDEAMVQRPDHPVLMVGIANGGTIGGGAPLAPDATPDDGLLDIVIASGAGPLERVGYALDLRAGDHTGRDDVTVYRARTVTVRAMDGGSFSVNTDGEVTTGVLARSWTVHHHAWALLVPGG
ncbi:MAG TPA: YegS/Rv2252/BmrU family lipid kinase [Cryptosporangiaceae bacterium]|nr:YegS/Rv2252/BmrU family lipid kinase [Cryptosporangiaceae bacterium]